MPSFAYCNTVFTLSTVSKVSKVSKKTKVSKVSKVSKVFKVFDVLDILDILDIRDILDNVLEEDQSQGVVVMFLPVSVVAVASILASTASSVRHSLVFAGFSSQALHQLLDTGQVSCVLTDHDHCHKVQRLLQDPSLLRGNISVIYLDSGQKDFISDLEHHHIDPIFALYTGGPSSLIAGEFFKSLSSFI